MAKPKGKLDKVIDTSKGQIHFDTQKASYSRGKQLLIYDIWSKSDQFGSDIQGTKQRNVFFDNSAAIVIKIDIDSYLADDTKQEIQAIIKQLGALRDKELKTTSDRKGNKIIHKPTFVLLNKFNSHNGDKDKLEKLK
jgi:hypothetical protein